MSSSRGLLLARSTSSQVARRNHPPSQARAPARMRSSRGLVLGRSTSSQVARRNHPPSQARAPARPVQAPGGLRSARALIEASLLSS
jgi:hypothetical protein